jgi:ABC-type polar amino acid transport system ATPase subunit
LKDDGCIDKSQTFDLFQKLLVLRNINEAEVKRRKSDRNIQDIGTMILRQDLMISE